MDEDKNTQPTEDFHPTDAVEASPETQPAKPQLRVRIFQTTRLCTEEIVKDFETKEQAEAFARDLCEDKGIKPDFEVDEVPVPEPVATPVLDNAAAQAQETNQE